MRNVVTVSPERHLNIIIFSNGPMIKLHRQRDHPVQMNRFNTRPDQAESFPLIAE